MPTRRSISQMRYDKEKTRHYGMKLHLQNDADIIAMLETQPSFQAYVKRLIRTDIEVNGIPRDDAQAQSSPQPMTRDE